MVYDLQSTQVCTFFRSTSDALLNVLLKYSNQLQPDAGAPIWDRFAFSNAHAALLSEALRAKQSSAAVGADAGGVNGVGGSAGGGPHTSARAGAAGGGAGAAGAAGGGGGAAAGAGREGRLEGQVLLQQRQQDNQALLARLLAAVPTTPQALCPNPLLDPTLYSYDEKMIGPIIK